MDHAHSSSPIGTELSRRQDHHIGRALRGKLLAQRRQNRGMARNDAGHTEIGALARDINCKQPRNPGVAVEECLRRLQRHQSPVPRLVLDHSGPGAIRHAVVVSMPLIHDCWPAAGSGSRGAGRSGPAGVIGATCSRAPAKKSGHQSSLRHADAEDRITLTARCGSRLAGVKALLAHSAVAARADLSTANLTRLRWYRRIGPCTILAEWPCDQFCATR